MSEILIPPEAAEAKTVDFPSGSSPMRDADAFGHVAEHLGEIGDALRALAFRGGVHGKTARSTFAHLIGQMNQTRDSLRAVALLRGNEKWLPFASMVEDMRVALTQIGMAELRGWPTQHFLALAKNFSIIAGKCKAMKDLREKQSQGWTG